MVIGRIQDQKEKYNLEWPNCYPLIHILFLYRSVANTFTFTSFFSDTAIVVNRPDMGDYGTMFKIVPYTTQNFVNKITCFKVPGSKDAKVTAQGVLPNVSLYNVSPQQKFSAFSTVWSKILVVIKFGSLVPNGHYKYIGGF